MKIKVAIEHDVDYISLSRKQTSLSKVSQMKIIIALMITLASITMANDQLDGRAPGIEVSFEIPAPKIERDSVTHVSKPKEITRFDEYIMLEGPVALEDGLKAELAYLPWF